MSSGTGTPPPTELQLKKKYELDLVVQIVEIVNGAGQIAQVDFYCRALQAFHFFFSVGRTFSMKLKGHF
jgi:hypothetical protein